MSKRARANVMLFITAFIWGSAFVAQKVGADIGTFTYNGIRTFIGGLTLIPVILLMDSMRKKKAPDEVMTEEEKKADRKVWIVGGICCGLALFAASTLQQYGIAFTTAGNAGFITALYCIIVPFMSLFLGKKIRPIVWLAVILGVIGLYLLCIEPGQGLHLQKGDFFVLLCAFAFAVHIMVIDHFSPKTDGVKLSCVQFLVAGAMGIVLMFIFEPINISAILAYWFPILYAGIMSCGIAYTLQVVAQADANPTEASLILCLESVFAVIMGAIILGESMHIRGYMGCALILGAVVLSQLPSKDEKLPVRE